jgi:hypothetical protein
MKLKVFILMQHCRIVIGLIGEWLKTSISEVVVISSSFHNILFQIVPIRMVRLLYIKWILLDVVSTGTLG